MEYAIYPMKTISMSQIYSTGHKAWDCNGQDKGKDYWYPPCRIKVLAVFPYGPTGFFNTVLFGTCDENGEPAAVMCEDGVARILTIGCTHIDTEDWNTFNYVAGETIFDPADGKPCYREGFTGLDPNNPKHGNHVHMDVGEGWQYEKVKIDGGWHLKNTMLPDGRTLIGNTFHQLEGFNTIGNAGTQGVTFKKVTSRIVDEKPPFALEGAYLKAEQQKFRVRKSPVSGAEVAMVNIGQSAEIKEFLGIQSDGYQWAKVYQEEQDISGYSQIDTNKCYTVIAA